MDTLKKILVVAVLAYAFNGLQAQSPAVMQEAFSRSYVAEESGNYTAAIQELKAVSSEESYFINVRLGWLNYMAKQYTEAIRCYEKAILLKPYAIEARFGCVKPLSAIESWDKVKEQYLKILAIDAQNITANYWLGVIYYNRKEYSAAIKNMEKVVNLYPLDYDSVIMLGWSKLYDGKTSDAKLLFNHALTIRPGDASALSGIKQIK